ncbi:MAG: hypothetical protein OEY29_13975 [Gammaproteobacteria bacterium]|nr:hypothetical protein [Gammaproteobacteria bacterium]
MYRLLFAILVSVFLLPAQAFDNTLPAKLQSALNDNWYCVSLTRHDDLSAVCAIRGPLYFEWYQIDHFGRPVKLRNQPSAGITPYQILLSENEKTLAMIYADEGHPVLVVHSIDRLLSGNSDMDFVKGLYPGSLHLLCWHDNQIILESDQDLSKPWHGSNHEPDGGGVFKLNPVSHQISRSTISACKQANK